MQANDHGTNAAVAGVYAHLENAGVGLTKLVDRIFVENMNHFAEPDFARRPRQCVTAVGPALRLNQTGLYQDPHQLAGVGDRKPFAICDLI